ncbi:MAG: hypothetical protein ACRC0X_06475 [Brevinema sp.]
MKKSLLALSVLFILGACSVAPSSEVKGFLGGKTITSDLVEGTFNTDATELKVEGEGTFKIQKGSTANSATYLFDHKPSPVTTSFILTEITATGGKVKFEEKSPDGTTSEESTFTLK